jgi:RNA polymerase sigma-70 factor (ECF subfamily)
MRNTIQPFTTISDVSRQDALYREAAGLYGAAIERIARGYEADPEKRRDLVQEIHLSLWRTFEKYEARCSLRTWVYRVAHNTAVSHVIQQRRTGGQLVTLEELETLPGKSDHQRETEDRLALERLLGMIHRLKPMDRQLMLLYLEDMDAASIGEITGISAGNVRIQIHRIKAILARRFHGGNAHDA